MSSRLFLLAVAAVLATAATGVSADFEATVETPEVLPEGPGRDETFYTCTACHGSLIIRQQGMSRALWDATLDFMVERHNMTPLEGAERQLVLDYLASSFPPRNRPRGRPNPFATTQ